MFGCMSPVLFVKEAFYHTTTSFHCWAENEAEHVVLSLLDSIRYPVKSCHVNTLKIFLKSFYQICNYLLVIIRDALSKSGYKKNFNPGLIF